MLKLINRIEAVDNIIYKVQKIAILIAATAMVVVNAAQVLFRYVIHSSLPWSEQVSLVLFLVLIMLGGNLAVKKNAEIKIEVFRPKNKKAAVILALASDLFSVIAIVVFLISSFMLIKQASQFTQLLSSIKLDYKYIYMCLPIGFVLIIIDKILWIFKRIAALSGKLTLDDVLRKEDDE